MVACEGVLENKQTADFVLGNMDKLAKTENMFFLEEEADEKVLEEFKKQAYKVQEFKLLLTA